jgi:hypothetical protein
MHVEAHLGFSIDVQSEVIVVARKHLAGAVMVVDHRGDAVKSKAIEMKFFHVPPKV